MTGQDETDVTTMMAEMQKEMARLKEQLVLRANPAMQAMYTVRGGKQDVDPISDTDKALAALMEIDRLAADYQANALALTKGGPIQIGQSQLAKLTAANVQFNWRMPSGLVAMTYAMDAPVVNADYLDTNAAVGSATISQKFGVEATFAAGKAGLEDAVKSLDRFKGSIDAMYDDAAAQHEDALRQANRLAADGQSIKSPASIHTNKEYAGKTQDYAFRLAEMAISGALQSQAQGMSAKLAALEAMIADMPTAQYEAAIAAVVELSEYVSGFSNSGSIQAAKAEKAAVDSQYNKVRTAYTDSASALGKADKAITAMETAVGQDNLPVAQQHLGSLTGVEVSCTADTAGIITAINEAFVAAQAKYNANATAPEQLPIMNLATIMAAALPYTSAVWQAEGISGLAGEVKPEQAIEYLCKV